MSSPKKNVIIDPDYEMSEVVRERVRLKGERESKEKMQKLRSIIDSQFQTELAHRQSQLELIQQRLNQAQKTLHLLRYVLITSYYNEDEKLINQIEESTSNEEVSVSNRLHPAVKKLLGNNPHEYKLNFAKTPRKKLRHLENARDLIIKSENLYATQTSHKSNRTNVMAVDQTDVQYSTTDSEAKCDGTREEFDTGRNRRKSKYRIVVGNISKWMPSQSEEDKSTHKWMVYVRGSKESPDISHFVQKVIFHLHPSYQPNDIIELREGPFHLARRGWGEFPLRVRIYFQCPLNKPVDIIHKLKLDKTFTGLQTLGNETVVNLFLYDGDNTRTEEDAVKDEVNPEVRIKEEVQELDELDDFNLDEVDSKANIQFVKAKPNHIVQHYEHDYCCLGIKHEFKEENNYQLDVSLPSTSAHHTIYDPLTEHSYFRNNSFAHAHCKTSFENTLEEQPTDLMYGIIDMEESKNQLIEETVLDDVKIPTRQTPQIQRFVVTNGTVIAIKKRRRPQESLLKKIFHKRYEKEIATSRINSGGISILRRTYSDNKNTNKRPKHEITENCEIINYDKYKVDFPSHRFNNVSEALPYLFKRLPLITETVSDRDYKCTYPYAAESLEKYSSWNIGRRLSSEWFQAKTILNILTASNLADSKNWTTKSIIMYARSRGYTPLCNYQIFKSKSGSPEEILNGVPNNACASTNPIIKPKITELTEPDVMVDVVNCNPETKSSNHKEKLIDEDLELACSYVKQELLDIGIILKPEEIIPGVLFNAAERVLLQAALCLAEDLTRRARTNLVLQGNFHEETSTIRVEEIHKALRGKPQFNVLLKTNVND